MSEENKKPAFGDIIIRAIKEPEYLDKMESAIDDYVENVYDIDNTSMYDVKPIAMELEPPNNLGKINIPENKAPKLLNEVYQHILDSAYTMWHRSDEGPNQDMNKKMTEKPFVISTK